MAAAAATDPGGAFVRTTVVFPPAPQALFLPEDIVCAGRRAVGCVSDLGGGA